MSPSCWDFLILEIIPSQQKNFFILSNTYSLWKIHNKQDVQAHNYLIECTTNYSSDKASN